MRTRFIPLAVVGLIFTVGLAVGIAKVGGPALHPESTGSTCANNVVLYEDANAGGDNFLKLCANGFGDGYWGNLGNYAVNGDGRCNQYIGYTTNWNDCTTSAVIKLDSGTCASGWVNTSLGGPQVFFARGPKNYALYNFTGVSNETLSSVEIYTPC